MTTESNPAITLKIASSRSEVTRKVGKRFVDFTVLQLNDVYEAAPVEGGRLGGLARVATLCQKLKKENPNFMVILAGDFLAPSAIGATTGSAGQHMIEALNAMGLDYVTVGNHEFDVSESDLVERIAESRFKWVVSNVGNGKGEPFPKTVKSDVVEYKNEHGSKVRVALIGLCLDMVKKPWLTYQDPVVSARQQVAELEGKADLFLAMTHLTIDQDRRLGTEVPRIDVLFGGHEHEAATAIVGEDATPIFKADSNARSVCIHRFRYDTKERSAKLHTQLLPINSELAEDAETAKVVEKWMKVTLDTLRAQGMDPDQVVGYTDEALDGFEASVRNRPTNLTRLIVETFLKEVPDADAVMFSSGMIRIDSIIPPGKITYFDIVQMFPLGGKLSVLGMPGKLIKLLLSVGERGTGTGAYLALANIARSPSGEWTIKGEAIVDDKFYKIILQETPVAVFSYPPLKGSGITKYFDTRDIRAIMAERLGRDSTAT